MAYYLSWYYITLIICLSLPSDIVFLSPFSVGSRAGPYFLSPSNSRYFVFDIIFIWRETCGTNEKENQERYLSLVKGNLTKGLIINFFIHTLKSVVYIYTIFSLRIRCKCFTLQAEKAERRAVVRWRWTTSIQEGHTFVVWEGDKLIKTLDPLHHYEILVSKK